VKRAFSKQLLQRLFLLGAMCFLFVFLPTINQQAYSQDVFSIYYPSGDHKLADANKVKLRKFVFSNTLSKIDSMQVIGYADSTGKKLRNMNLSKRRSSIVKKFLVQLTRKKIPVSAYARGEENARLNPNENHRRVEVQLYIAGRSLEDSIEQLEYFGDTKTCFVLSDTIMRYANIIRVDDGTSHFVILEMEPHLFNKNQTYYSLSRNSLYAKKLKWKLEYTGNSWWRHERYRTRIKEVDFNAYGVLNKKIIPKSYDECLVCSNDMGHNLKMTSELLPDAFLMQNLQLQPKRVEGEYLLIAPVDYVNPDKSYYVDNNYDHEIRWKQKFGLRNRPYFFASVSKDHMKDTLWNVYTHHEICLPSTDTANRIDYPVEEMGAHLCKPQSRGSIYALEYGVEAGFWNLDYYAAYLAAFAQYVGTSWETGLSAGIDLKARFQLQAKFDYQFLSFSPFKNPLIGNSNRSIIHDFHRTFVASVGTDFSFSPNKGMPFVNQGLYLGMAYKNNPFAFGIDRVYLQVGATANYLRSSFSPNLYLRVGVKFKI
jgi:hypothetical protein